MKPVREVWAVAPLNIIIIMNGKFGMGFLNGALKKHGSSSEICNFL
jgi:hypothetical protein